MEGGQSSTYLRQTRTSSSPQVSVTKTYRDQTKRKHRIYVNLICTPYLKLKIMKKRFVSNVIRINGRVIGTVFYLNLFTTTMDLSYTIYINHQIIELKVPYC